MTRLWKARLHFILWVSVFAVCWGLGHFIQCLSKAIATAPSQPRATVADQRFRRVVPDPLAAESGSQGPPIAAARPVAPPSAPSKAVRRLGIIAAVSEDSSTSPERAVESQSRFKRRISRPPGTTPGPVTDNSGRTGLAMLAEDYEQPLLITITRGPADVGRRIVACVEWDAVDGVKPADHAQTCSTPMEPGDVADRQFEVIMPATIGTQAFWREGIARGYSVTYWDVSVPVHWVKSSSEHATISGGKVFVMERPQ